MSVTQAAALSFLMGQHSSEEQARTANHEPTVKVEVSMVPRPSKKIAKVSSPIPQQLIGAVAATTSEPGSVVVMPKAGDLGPKGYILAMRKARTQQERIVALAAYVGYDPAKEFGTQVMMADSRAKRELQGFAPIPGPSIEEKRAASRSMTGFVAGLPDTTQRKIADLMGRETASAERLIAHERDAADKSRTVAERTLSKGLAEVESERLREIRADLKSLGG